MGVRLERRKPRNIIASLAYRVNRLLPRKLDVMLDLAVVANRLAMENAVSRGHEVWGDNRFVQKHIRPTDRVLEVGCNAGRVLSQVKAAHRVGVDRDDAAIERGRKAHSDITLIHGEAHAYLASAEAFDVLILSHVLEHLDDPEAFLASFAGHFDRIYIEVPDFDQSVLNSVRLKRGRTLIYTDEDHVAEFDRDELEALFASLGLTVIDSEFRWGFMRYWLTTPAPSGGGG